MSTINAYNFRRIDKSVATAGLVNAEELANLRDAGIEVVINLLPDENDGAIEGEQQIVESQGIEYIYIPVDFAAPQPKDYVQFRDHMAKVGNRSVLIHCAANYRVSAFYSLYAREVGEWSEDQANEFVKSIWNPQDYPGWPEFLEKVQQSG